ncbi:hypothetical protein N431DRAFT_454709 [Stipitochalara longipes BDJ]|nr:hypothetical protein N431DRAFT_454709 [Stipitochalara longipes BDJ]
MPPHPVVKPGHRLTVSIVESHMANIALPNLGIHFKVNAQGSFVKGEVTKAVHGEVIGEKERIALPVEVNGHCRTSCKSWGVPCEGDGSRFLARLEDAAGDRNSIGNICKKVQRIHISSSGPFDLSEVLGRQRGSSSPGKRELPDVVAQLGRQLWKECEFIVELLNGGGHGVEVHNGGRFSYWKADCAMYGPR